MCAFKKKKRIYELEFFKNIHMQEEVVLCIVARTNENDNKKRKKVNETRTYLKKKGKTNHL